MVNGLSSSNLGIPNHTIALAQHDAYIEALRHCGLDVTVLDPDEDYPDSTFVEDPALVTPTFAIIMRPGAPSRRGETRAIARALSKFRDRILFLEPPATADGGDIMAVNGHFYVGLSQRTNKDGANQILEIIKAHAMTGSTIPLKDMLHLKSGAAYLGNERLVLGGELLGRPEFSKYAVIPVDDDESYAANCLWLNGTVLIASGYPKTKRAIEAYGYRTIELEVSEFRKLDGGLSCLSLRF
jgi:dimethylargininase